MIIIKRDINFFIYLFSFFIFIVVGTIFYLFCLFCSVV